jgi:hypothetical protein
MLEVCMNCPFSNRSRFSSKTNVISHTTEEVADSPQSSGLDHMMKSLLGISGISTRRQKRKETRTSLLVSMIALERERDLCRNSGTKATIVLIRCGAVT